MEELLRDLLHRRNYCYAHLLVRGNRVRGLVASPPYGALLLCALHQGKFFWSGLKSKANLSLRIVKCKYERRVIHDVVGCYGDEALGHNASF
jgi:hypothetical protein